jgi:uncharacterized protein
MSHRRGRARHITGAQGGHEAGAPAEENSGRSGPGRPGSRGQVCHAKRAHPDRGHHVAGQETAGPADGRDPRYAAFAKGDLAGLTDLFAEDPLWHDSGRNQLSGDFRGREAVFGLFGKLMEVTEGSFRIDLRALYADDERGVALVILTASRGGRSVEVREAHVFHMRDGKVAEFWNASADQHAFDELIG